MTEDIIKKMLDERAEFLKTVLQAQKELDKRYDQLMKMNDALASLKGVYPEFFPKNEIQERAGVNGYTYNRNLPLRKRIKELLKSMRRFAKVSELAKIIHQEEELFSPNTEEEWQKKISAALTSLKLDPKERVIKKQIEPGSSGWAWGLEDWITEEENFLYEQERQKQIMANEYDEMKNIFE